MNLHQNFLDQILFVIVVYQKEPRNCVALQSLIASLAPGALQCHISIYDNSPSSRTFVSQPHHLMVHHYPQNNGLSKCYNDAFLEATSLKKHWLFFLDQDTELPPEFFNAYYLATRLFPNEVLFAPVVKDSRGILSPVRFVRGRGKRTMMEEYGLTPFDKLRPINTGMMTRLEAFKQANGFEESIKLDFSDFAFTEKMKKIHENFVVVDLVLRQDFFDNTASKSDAFQRFKFFHEGALEMGRIFGPSWIYYYRALTRALYLSIRFKSFIFINFFVKSKNKAV